ncbi:MAG: hypothetical protein LC740_10525 [Actinobacteria bacterium]|nr:hypothetical protein [Actinomycetota bacterium]
MFINCFFAGLFLACLQTPVSLSGVGLQFQAVLNVVEVDLQLRVDFAFNEWFEQGEEAAYASFAPGGQPRIAIEGIEAKADIKS